MALTDDPNFQKLQDWFRANSGSLNMREMFDKDPQRFSKFRWVFWGADDSRPHHHASASLVGSVSSGCCPLLSAARSRFLRGRLPWSRDSCGVPTCPSGHHHAPTASPVQPAARVLSCHVHELRLTLACLLMSRRPLSDRVGLVSALRLNSVSFI